MITTPQMIPEKEEIVPPLPRSTSVVMGRQDYASTLLRLVAMELYKIRRRMMSKALAAVGFGLIFVITLLLGIIILERVNEPLRDFAPQHCSRSAVAGCINHPPTTAELEQNKQQVIKILSGALRLPTSLGVFHAEILTFLLPLLYIILFGSAVGGEYSIGTIRLLFTRGPTRIQFLLAKIGAALFTVVVGVAVIILFGILLGEAFNPISGIAQSFSFFNAAWLGHALLLLLVFMLYPFVYAMMALFFGTLGRSSTAGIVGGILWFVIELVLNTILAQFLPITSGTLQDVLKTISDCLITNNLGALLANQAHEVAGSAASSLSNSHALLVIAVYLVIFIGISSWLTIRRDITN